MKKAKSRKYTLSKTCSTRRRDVETGQLVPSCNEPQKPEKGFLEDLEIRFIMKCDESGEPAFVRIRGVDSEEIREFRRRVRKGEISKSDLNNYLSVLKEEAEKDLQERFDRARSSAAFEQSLKSDQSRKGAKTQAVKKAAVTADEKAQDQAKALEARLEILKMDLSRLATGRKREALRNRISRLAKAKGQLEKISQGKAYKWPAPSLMR